MTTHLKKMRIFGVLGAWMTFKKPEKDKTLRNGLSMSERDPLNWVSRVILALNIGPFFRSSSLGV